MGSVGGYEQSLPSLLLYFFPLVLLALLREADPGRQRCLIVPAHSLPAKAETRASVTRLWGRLWQGFQRAPVSGVCVCVRAGTLDLMHLALGSHASFPL